MPYIYVAMWLAVGALLIYTAKKEGKIFYLAGGYFVILGIWWLLDILLDGIMLKGPIGIGFKIFTVAILAILLVFYIRHQKEVKASRENTEDKQKPKGDF